ncbi:membrane protein [Catellatospora sp. TT07R-123]|uniref:glycosyltransferase family 39 protein n=1 Tax=Catellatospora sp. TT07R-123 TaxID=2733863 RepID=UPI001AFCEC1D|nr:glycosyltransferase family 39 protein [Catellatospora sp. TT07R-123]GHJ45972.1 membrane protein [Catellatospora sp. TT07R-123]
MSSLSQPGTAPAVAAPGGPPLSRLKQSFLAAWPALVAYAVARAVGVGVYLLVAHLSGRDGWHILGHRTDAGFYFRIITEGYSGPQVLDKNDMAFFPLYPMLVRGVHEVVPLPADTVAILVSWLAALIAAWGVYAVGAHLHDRRTGVLLALLWGLLPHAIVESMAYTEAIFTAFVAWALLALLRERWVAAGALALLAGLTRPTALALIPVVGLAALIAVVKTRGRAWQPWVGMLLAPLGWLGYILWVAQRTGRLDGWFHIQDAGWGSRFDGGVFTAKTMARLLKHNSSLDAYLVSFVLLVAVALFALTIIDRQPWQLLLFSGLILLITVGGMNYYNSKARFLLPAFALLVPVATALARTRPARMAVIVLTIAAASTYCGVYLLLIWKLSP